ncbi:MAG: acetolactate synthase small subunit [Omnitrophica WOR_2 bacterium RIFCSPHIGHO2_02_FULL_68_15]|nr:MAG: acetolactate synthase small subunit [Omnitrophica WOR_2 bacterium RIFCSPHIGHO2_02_FULL_68_15]
MPAPNKHTLSVVVENKFGVLARIATIIAGRGFNIDSLAVGETEDPTTSRMTIVFQGDERTIDQVKKQLNRLVDVITVQDLTKGEFIDRELMLVRVAVTAKSRAEVMDIAQSLKAKVDDVGTRSLVLQIVGDTAKIRSALELLKPYGIQEIVRTGRIAMAREVQPENTKTKATSGV